MNYEFVFQSKIYNSLIKKEHESVLFGQKRRTVPSNQNLESGINPLTPEDFHVFE